ncbi:AbrB family transcriptional regulator [Mesorhizobium sp. L-8-10]|uniref:AbrB/MazE/SpoVT family DNA-binding domain-containing protein n=1 Tax=Mesorhizobium sp. L-8-10 TaxID=2744523 RepID=UPI0019256C30|nr:AbrB/MazE/SpoVT family DNA-binding domain-containing protein [Mesorhizobium sp. L-8-10]BCH30234.1 AbrB family transcriptional regulator [Mesorhizobium sp. L-8-10]
MGAFTTMTSKGQLTIPKAVRDALKLGPGTKFFVTVRDGQVVASPKNRQVKDLAGMLGRPPSGEVLSVEQMNEAVRGIAGEEDERITRQWRDGRK